MKRIFIFLYIITFISCAVKDPKPESCRVRTVTINNVAKGTSNDIVFFSNTGDRFYINRGFEYGLNLDTLNAKVSNKTVTLHVPKLLGGLVISEHIAQIVVDGDTLFTEFKN